MAMLAEKRKRTKYCLNPNGNDWVNDDCKFGQKILEKMGWQKGQGLGANNQGITERLKMHYKIDSKGLGFKEKDSLLEQQNNFQALLSELNNENGKTMNEHLAVASLEEKSKKLKSRVHYQKFTRGKDISRYTNKDLSCILGTGLKTHSQSDSGMQDPVTENNGNLIYGGSMNSYFEEKLARNSKNMEMEVEINEEFSSVSNEKGDIANESNFSLDHNSEVLNSNSKKRKRKNKSDSSFIKEEGEKIEEVTADISDNHGIDSSGKKKCKKSKRQKDTEQFPDDTQTEELNIEKESKSLFSQNSSLVDKRGFSCQKIEATEEITKGKKHKKPKKKKSVDQSFDLDLDKLQNNIKSDFEIIESESTINLIEENKLSETDLQNNLVSKINSYENHDYDLCDQTMGIRKKSKKRKQKRSEKEENKINLNLENDFNKNELQDVFEKESNDNINCDLNNENVNILKKHKKRKLKKSDEEKDIDCKQIVTENCNKNSSEETSLENIHSGKHVEIETYLNDGIKRNETELKNNVVHNNNSRENNDFDSGNEALPVCEKSKKRKLESSSEISSSSKKEHGKKEKEQILNDRNNFNNNELQNSSAYQNDSTENNFDVNQKTASSDMKSDKKSYDKDDWACYQQVVRTTPNNRGRDVNPKRTILNNYLSRCNEALERKREAKLFKMNAVPKFNGFVGSNLHSVKGYGESLNKKNFS